MERVGLAIGLALVGHGKIRLHQPRNEVVDGTVHNNRLYQPRNKVVHGNPMLHEQARDMMHNKARHRLHKHRMHRLHQPVRKVRCQGAG